MNKRKSTIRAILLKWAYRLCGPDRDYSKIPVLCYHRILPESAEMRYPLYSISLDNFEEHLKAIIRMGYRTLHLDEYIEHLKGNLPVTRKSLLLTIDDGFYDAFSIAWPIAKKYDATLNLFITADENGSLADYYPCAVLTEVDHHIRKHSGLWRRIGWDDLKTMCESGCGVGLHGYRHDRLTQYDLGTVRKIQYQLSR